MVSVLTGVGIILLDLYAHGRAMPFFRRRQLLHRSLRREKKGRGRSLSIAHGLCVVLAREKTVRRVRMMSTAHGFLVFLPYPWPAWRTPSQQ